MDINKIISLYIVGILAIIGMTIALIGIFLECKKQKIKITKDKKLK